MLGKCCRNVLNFGEDKANLGGILQWKILPTTRVSLENSMVFTSKEDNNKMEHRQGHQKTKLRVHQYLLIDPKSDPSVSKVVQQTYVYTTLP